MGRGIRKIVSLFENLSTIVDEADRRMLEEEEAEADVAANGTEPVEDEENIKRV